MAKTKHEQEESSQKGGMDMAREEVKDIDSVLDEDADNVDQDDNQAPAE